MSHIREAVNRAIEIGKECAAIDSAIKQLGVATSNRISGAKVYDNQLFEELSARREGHRAELLTLAWALKEGGTK